MRLENRNLTSAENLKLAKARKPILNSCILVAYPRLNQGEWVSPLVHSQHKFDTVLGGGAQGLQKYTAPMASSKKKKKNKQNLSESDSEKEAADFPRFIVIEFLEEV